MSNTTGVSLCVFPATFLTDCIHGARSRLYGHCPVHCQPQVHGSGCYCCTRFLALTFARGLRLCRYVPAIIVSTTMLLEPAVGTAIGVLLQETPIPGNMTCRTTETTTPLAYKANGGSSHHCMHVMCGEGLFTYVGMLGAMIGLAFVSVGSVKRQQKEKAIRRRKRAQQARDGTKYQPV